MPALSHTHPIGVTANEENAMKQSAAVLIVLAGLVISLAGGFGVPVASAAARDAFGFNSTDISGFPTGNVILTGGGAYVPGTDFAHAGGHFHCTASVTQGPLSMPLHAPLTGCLAGQGIRWDTARLLSSTALSCTGTDTEPLATTGDTTVVLLADFYRQGDGNDESFRAKMVVSDGDIAPNIGGVQTVWIQGVGCGTGIANFN